MGYGVNIYYVSQKQIKIIRIPYPWVLKVVNSLNMVKNIQNAAFIIILYFAICAFFNSPLSYSYMFKELLKMQNILKNLFK